ncbi:unnamed protein product [Ambrosiozyma monospora]|uniref:Unnamed protein product n=1 Tax=Ambrosiozyma monospora TaxID=43982 RepID=A0ACB5SVE1_AMBMO|nr:unnamed protein product [Ambrosiozyma monospora]
MTQETEQNQEELKKQEKNEIIRKSDFSPKVYDSDDPQTSFIHHYSLWRMFVDLPEQQFQLRKHEQQQSDQQPPASNEDDTRRLFTQEDAQGTNITAEDPLVTIRGQGEDIESTSPPTHIPHPRARTDPNSLSTEEQRQLLSDYLNSASRNSIIRSAKRDGRREKLWELSDFSKREKEYPGCTVTIADFSETRYRFERRTIYTEDAHGNYLPIHDCDPEETPKEVFLEKLKESKEGLVKALRNKPGWSKLRWVNVNGAEKSTFFSIMDEFELDSKATNYMFNAGDNFNVDTYKDDQLFCELCVLYCFEDSKNIDQLVEPPEETMVEKLHRLYPDVTTYLKAKNKLRIFNPDEENRSFIDEKGTEFSKKADKFEESKLLNTYNYSIGVERAWLFKTRNQEVISFFENSGELVEETVLFDFITNLSFHGEMEINDSVCFENILSAFAMNLETLVKFYQSLLYKFKVDLNTNASTKRLLKLHLMTDELNALKLRVDRLAKMVDLLGTLSTLSNDSKPYMSELKETLDGFDCIIKEMIDSIKNLIDLTFNQDAADTSNYMALLALVSIIFLPMSFVSSFFGMNYFPQPLQHISVFWASSVALTVFTVFCVGTPIIKRLLSDPYSRTYNYFFRKIRLFKAMVKNRRSQKNGNNSTKETQGQTKVTPSQSTGSQVQDPETGVLHTGSSTQQAVNSSTSSSTRQRNTSNDVSSNNSRGQPNLTDALHISSSSQTTNGESSLSRPNVNNGTSLSSITTRPLTPNVDLHNRDPGKIV